jgi:hypothetical protein
MLSQAVAEFSVRFLIAPALHPMKINVSTAIGQRHSNGSMDLVSTPLRRISLHPHTGASLPRGRRRRTLPPHIGSLVGAPPATKPSPQPIRRPGPTCTEASRFHRPIQSIEMAPATHQKGRRRRTSTAMKKTGKRSTNLLMH